MAASFFRIHKSRRSCASSGEALSRALRFSRSMDSSWPQSSVRTDDMPNLQTCTEKSKASCWEPSGKASQQERPAFRDSCPRVQNPISNPGVCSLRMLEDRCGSPFEPLCTHVYIYIYKWLGNAASRWLLLASSKTNLGVPSPSSHCLQIACAHRCLWRHSEALPGLASSTSRRSLGPCWSFFVFSPLVPLLA